MRKVVDYIILCSESRGTLRKEVVEKLKEGWELYGTPYVSPLSNHYQAMVLYGPEVDKIGKEL